MEVNHRPHRTRRHADAKRARARLVNDAAQVGSARRACDTNRQARRDHAALARRTRGSDMLRADTDAARVVCRWEVNRRPPRKRCEARARPDRAAVRCMTQAPDQTAQGLARAMPIQRVTSSEVNPFATARSVADNNAICILNGGEVNRYVTPTNDGMFRSPCLLHPRWRHQSATATRRATARASKLQRATMSGRHAASRTMSCLGK